MSFLKRLLAPRGDGQARYRALWHRVVELSRDPEWYRAGVADTVPGRFDAITLVLALVLLRMEREPELIEPSVRLTELFVADMDGQLREAGVGDLVVGKRMGKLMGALGGRLGAFREALADEAPAALEAAIGRNMTLNAPEDASAVAVLARHLAARIEATAGESLLAGAIAA